MLIIKRLLDLQILIINLNLDSMSEVLKEILEKQSWEVKESTKSYFTEDAIIDAYNAGKTYTLNKLKSEIKKDLEFVSKSVEGLLNKMFEKGFTPTSANIKLNDWKEFEVLITVPEEEYVSDSFLEIYDISSEIEIKSNNNLCLTFLFVDSADSLDDEIIISDGYFLKYKNIDEIAKNQPPQREEKPRKA